MMRLQSKVALTLGGFALFASLAPIPKASPQAGELRALAESRAKVARQIADFYADPRLAALETSKVDSRSIPGTDAVEVWTRKFVDARLDASTGNDRIAILKEDLARTKAIEARLKELAENTPGLSKIDTLKAQFYRLDAEYRLAKEQQIPGVSLSAPGNALESGL